MGEWIFNDIEQYAYLKTKEGSAEVSLIEDEWRWHGYATESMAAMIDRDGDWGICSTRAEAQKSAEDYLRRYGAL